MTDRNVCFVPMRRAALDADTGEVRWRRDSGDYVMASHCRNRRAIANPGSMTTQTDNAAHPQVQAKRRLRKYPVRRVLATTVAMSPPVICACLASISGNWDFFERSGSITTAIGLLVASRRYVEHGVLELTLQDHRMASDSSETFEDVVTAKLGLALSAFGTLVWGWGMYLGWWSFSCLLVWAFFAVRDARRDKITRTG